MENNDLNFVIEDNIPLPTKATSFKAKSKKVLRIEAIISTLNKLALGQSVMINKFNDLPNKDANWRLIKKCTSSLIETCKKNGNEVDYLIKYINDSDKNFIGYRIWRTL